MMLYEESFENLRNEMSDIEEILRFDIQRLKDGNSLSACKNYTALLNSLKDFQTMIQKLRNMMLKSFVPNNVRKLYLKAESEWKEVLKLIKEYDECVEENNKKNEKKLQKISDRINLKFLPSVKTKYFNY